MTSLADQLRNYADCRCKCMGMDTSNAGHAQGCDSPWFYQIAKALEEKAMPKIVDNGRTNPLIVVSPEEVVKWLRNLADMAGYGDRASCFVQISVTQEMKGMTHGETPTLVLMVSNIKNSRKPGDD